MANYFTLITKAGLAKITNAQLTNSKVEITEVVVGDGNGSAYTPTGTEMQLKRVVWRGGVTSVDIDSQNPNWIVAEAVIPATVGGFTIREVGLYDVDGTLIAIGNYPDTYKPVLADGSTMDLSLRTIIEVSNASSVTLRIDPNVIVASRKYVDDKVSDLDERVTEQLAQITTFVTPEMFGAKGDGVTNDTQSLKDMFFYATTNQKNIELTHGKSYLIDDVLNYTFTSHLSINFNGATVLPNKQSPGQRWYFEVTAPSIELKNANFDGHLTPQDQFNVTDYPQLVLTRAFLLKADTITVENVKIRNMYGDAFKFNDYSKISLKNIEINNVGGKWYQNNTYDAFGDAFYFGKYEGKALITMENVECIGKSKNEVFSRIGITIENLSSLVDEELVIDAVNCNFYKYNRATHCETIKGKAIFNVRNSNFLCDLLAINYNTDMPQFEFIGDNIKINYTANSFNSVRGVYKTKFTIKNSVINTMRDSLGSYDSSGVYQNCTINNVNDILFNGAGIIELHDCVLNVLNTMTTYLNYNSDVTLYNCTVNNSEPVDKIASTSGRALKSYKSAFNYYFPYATFLEAENKLYMSASFTKGNRANNVYIYKNNKLSYAPSSCRFFPHDYLYNETNYYRSRESASETDLLTLLPDDISFTPNQKVIMIMVGHNDSANLRYTNALTAFYYALVTTDANGVPTINTVYTAGSVEANRQLTIDNTNKTVSKKGTYSNLIQQIFIKYQDKEVLPVALSFT